jgi:hypothetical protein
MEPFTLHVDEDVAARLALLPAREEQAAREALREVATAAAELAFTGAWLGGHAPTPSRGMHHLARDPFLIIYEVDCEKRTATVLEVLVREQHVRRGAPPPEATRGGDPQRVFWN